MSSMKHDAVVESVISVHGEDDIDNAKKLIFEKCKESATKHTEMISQSLTVMTSSIN